MTFFKSCFSLTQFLVMALGRGLGLVPGSWAPRGDFQEGTGGLCFLSPLPLSFLQRPPGATVRLEKPVGVAF